MESEEHTSGVVAEHPSAQFIVLMTMLALFSVVGTVGNGLVIFVFQRAREKTTAQIFIIALAIIDLFTCTVIIPFTMFMEYSEYNIKYDFLCKLYQFLITSKIPLSAFIMVAIAFDRYFCICHPLKRFITILRAKIIVVFLTLLASMFGVITSLFYGVDVEVERINGADLSPAVRHNLSIALGNPDRLNSVIVFNSNATSFDRIQLRLEHALRELNYTVMWDLRKNYPTVKEIVYLGICHASKLILRDEVFHPYHKSYTALFAMCLVTVMILYFLIYRFMCARRSKKLKQKLVMCSYVNGDGMYLNTLGTTIMRDEDNGVNETCALTNNLSPPTCVHVFAGENGGTTSKPIHQTENDGVCSPDPHLLSPKMFDRSSRRMLSTSCSVLSGPLESDFPTNTTSISASNSCTNIDATAKSACGGSGSAIAGGGSSESKFNDTRSPHDGAFPRNSRQEQKYRWYKKRDSVKRYKGRKRDRHAGLHMSTGSRDYDPDRLREENRKANVKTAIMLFTVTLVFVIAFVPSWIMAHRLIPYQQLVFYLYFSYNVANPFIYAFMNHVFKAYMRKVFSCKRKSAMILAGQM